MSFMSIKIVILVSKIIQYQNRSKKSELRSSKWSSMYVDFLLIQRKLKQLYP